MPPSASSNRPVRFSSAPVNAPLHVAEELALDEAGRDRAAVDLDERAAGAAALRLWIARAKSSLPEPVSPAISTVESVGATRSTFERASSSGARFR